MDTTTQTAQERKWDADFLEIFGDSHAAVQTVRQAFDGKRETPDPAWVRGTCPQCGDDLVSNCYYVGGRGYLVTHDCWTALADAEKAPGERRCDFRKVI